MRFIGQVHWWGGLQPAADFSPPAAGFASLAGGGLKARLQTESLPHMVGTKALE